jgi:hypothetical protein
MFPDLSYISQIFFWGGGGDLFHVVNLLFNAFVLANSSKTPKYFGGILKGILRIQIK